MEIYELCISRLCAMQIADVQDSGSVDVCVCEVNNERAARGCECVKASGKNTC
jgi:hypothetical protein